MIDHLFVTLAATDVPPPSPMNSIYMMLAMAVIFYFLLIRPQQKRAKEQAAIIASVKTGDKVVMTGGIHGIVANVKDTTILVKVADNVKIEFDKASVVSITKASAES